MLDRVLRQPKIRAIFISVNSIFLQGIKQGVNYGGASIFITSGVGRGLLKLTEKQDTEWGRAISEVLFYLEMAAIVGYVGVGVHAFIQRSAQKALTHTDEIEKIYREVDELTKKNTDEFDNVIKSDELVAAEERLAAVKKLEEIAGVDMRVLKTFPLGSELEVLSSRLLRRYIVQLEQKLLKRGYKLEVEWIDESHRMFFTGLKGRVVVPEKGPITLLLRRDCPKMAWFHENIHIDDLLRLGRRKFIKMSIDEPWTLEWNVWEGLLKNRNKYREIELVSAYKYVKSVYNDANQVSHLFKSNKEMEILILKYLK